MPDKFPPLAALPQLTLHPSVDPEHLDAAQVVNYWLSSLIASLARGQSDDIFDHFLEKESWLKDFTSLSWGIACHNGAEAISNYLGTSKAGFSEPKADQPGALQPQLMDMGGMRFIQSGFSFKTHFGVGRGVLRLANIGSDQWKAWTLFTRLESLNEPDSPKPQSSISGDEALSSSNQADNSLQVLVVGAGHSGLGLAAHLQKIGLKYLVVDKRSRSGDSWRARYETIKLHTPIWTDHYPFMKYPSDWPKYLDQDHIAKWMEHYEDAMGLNVKHNTLASKIEYNQSTQRYSVELHCKEGLKTINPKHVVLATGLFSDIPIRPAFPGEDVFKGQIYHTLEHQSAASIPDLGNKKITVIGSGTSAHDIAQDFVDRGAGSVTMVQRDAMIVISLNSLETIQLPSWNTPGLSTEDADLFGNSFPTPLVRTLGVGLTQMMAANDKDLLDGLENAGLAVKRGNDGENLLDRQLIKGGHFYIDQGACQMIIDGRIQVQRCDRGVQEYYENGIILADGTKITSDVIVLATGLELCTKTIAQLMGKEVMDKVGNIGGLNESQERIGFSTSTGFPGFWFTAGSFMGSRQFSPILALQIAAIERGLNSYDAPQ